MSGPRRVGGRFVTTDEHTTYTRALVAPAAVWKKQWVVPSGLPQESKYKVLKWVKVDSKQDFSEESDSSPENGLSNVENDKPTLELPPAPTLRSHVSFAVESKPEVGTEPEDVEMSNGDSNSNPAATSTPAVASTSTNDASAIQTPTIPTPTPTSTEALNAFSSEPSDSTKPLVPNGSDNKGPDVAQIVESELSGMAVDGIEEGEDIKGEGAQAIALDESLKDSVSAAPTTATTTTASAPEPELSASATTAMITEPASDSTAAPLTSSSLSTNTASSTTISSSLPTQPDSASALPSQALTPTDSLTPLQPTEAVTSLSTPISRAESAEPPNLAPKPDTATVLPGTGAMDLTAAGTGEDPVGEGARIAGSLNSFLDQSDKN